MFAKFFQLNKCLKPKEVSLLPGLQIQVILKCTEHLLTLWPLRVMSV